MKEFECTDRDVLVVRGIVESFVASFGSYRSRGEKVVCRHLGVTELSPDPTAKVALHEFLSAMQELQQQFGTGFLHKAGTLIFHKAFPPGLDSVDKVMSILDQAYNRNHFNAEGRIGGYQWSVDGEGKGTMRADDPYPCAFDVGLLESIMTRLAPESGKVVHADGECRHKGGEACTYRIEW